MGREVRRVPPNWEHPKDVSGQYVSMYDETYKEASEEWMQELDKWREEGREGYAWEYFGNPPDDRCYRPEFTEEPTWYQLYQTVSEGYPVSPPFETPEELARYLSDKGDFWYQTDIELGREPLFSKPTYEQALSLVLSEWSPTMSHVEGKIIGPYEMQDLEE